MPTTTPTSNGQRPTFAHVSPEGLHMNEHNRWPKRRTSIVWALRSPFGYNAAPMPKERIWKLTQGSEGAITDKTGGPNDTLAPFGP
ncbi:hypothetical protein K443DRAFT_15014 [Laccaria amethystina LaAM-08-1]|uniref:Uncharacterized protein n=1 Tax=Laccaria amethystina LaAM-08-1 TaxID=1095629 RepID=A0A0C9WZE1_9AGAR|nr:hypothetical protein K443DRAFT_15014 [Laccaria amethystina LaAM-08-1]